MNIEEKDDKEKEGKYIKKKSFFKMKIINTFLFTGNVCMSKPVIMMIKHTKHTNTWGKSSQSRKVKGLKCVKSNLCVDMERENNRHRGTGVDIDTDLFKIDKEAFYSRATFIMLKY